MLQFKWTYSISFHINFPIRSAMAKFLNGIHQSLALKNQLKHYLCDSWTVVKDTVRCRATPEQVYLKLLNIILDKFIPKYEWSNIETKNNSVHNDFLQNSKSCRRKTDKIIREKVTVYVLHIPKFDFLKSNGKCET